MTSTRTRRLLGGGIALAVLVAAGLAYAAWTTSGTGEGYAEAGASQELTTVDVSADTAGDLYPGTSGDVVLEIENPNEYSVEVDDITRSGPITASGGIGTCTTTGVTFTDQTDQNIEIEGLGSAYVALPDAAQMSNASENGCQGAKFTIPLTLTGASNG